MNLRDTLERIVWTALVAALTAPALTTAAVAYAGGDIDGAKTAALAVGAAVLAAVVNAVLLVARARLSVLPSPGEGLPGLPVE